MMTDKWLDKCEVVEREGGIFHIHGERSPELAQLIRDVADEVSPSGEGLGMGFRAYSKSDLEFILSQARKYLQDERE